MSERPTLRANVWRPGTAAALVLSPPLLSLGIGLLCFLLALLTLLALSWMVGASARAVLEALFRGALGGRLSIVSTLRETAPIALAALAFLLPFKAGFFNIGGQGQLEIGALVAIAVAIVLRGPPLVVMLVALGAGAASAALLVLPALLLKVKQGASEVTTTIMLNFAAIQFVLAMVTGPMRDPTAVFGTTYPAPPQHTLPIIPGWLGVHAGVWLAIVMGAALFWLVKRTVFGFHLSAVGGNRAAAQAAGIPVDRILGLAVLLGAGMAGLAGGIQALGVVHRVAEGWSKPWGFTGILAALLGGNPLGVVPAAFALSVLETGARHMQAITGVPSALVYVLQSLPVILYLALKASAPVRRFSESSPMDTVAALAVERSGSAVRP